MATETLEPSRYISTPEVNLGPERRDRFGENTVSNVGTARYPVIHNFQHDLESLFWVMLWIVTARVGHKQSFAFSQKIFHTSLTLHRSRLNAFTETILDELKACLHPDLKCLAQDLNELRAALHEECLRRGIHGTWSFPASYSFIHDLFLDFFSSLVVKPSRKRGDKWKQVPLVSTPTREVPSSNSIRLGASSPEQHRERPRRELPEETAVATNLTNKLRSAGAKRSRKEEDVRGEESGSKRQKSIESK